MKNSNQSVFPHYEVLHALIEAARRNQNGIARSSEALSEAVKALERQTSALPMDVSAVLAAELASELTKRFNAVTQQAEQARIHFERAARISVWKLFAIPTLCFLIALLGLGLYLRFVLPDARRLQGLRAERDQLESGIELLEQKGGKAQLTNCVSEKGKSRLCIRTDETAGTYGDAQGRAVYRIIYGY